MDFEWDSMKEAANVIKHGVDFTLALMIFRSTFLSRPDERHDYGELRFVSIGYAEGHCLTVVWTPRGSRIRLISAWKGGDDEQEQYRAYVSRRGR